MTHRNNHFRIYKSRWHLVVTLLFVAAPFVFFLFFSRLAHIALTGLLKDLVISFTRLLIAYLLAASLGWLFSIAFYRGKRAAVALPVFDVLQSFPTFAALPLAVFWWGPSSLTVIIFLVITVIWPVFFSIISSLKLIRRDLREAVQIGGLTGGTYLRKFLWPASIPGLITGSIIGLGEGWEALIATEVIVQSQNGLGSFFQFFSHNPAITFFGILGFLTLIFSINKLLWLPLMEWSHRLVEE